MANPTQITCWGFDATPENVVLHPINSLDLAPLVMVYLFRWDMIPTFPTAGDVKLGTKYGPTGSEFIGTLSGGTGGGSAGSAILGG